MYKSNHNRKVPNMRGFITALILLIATTTVFAENHYTLYGYRIGQRISVVQESLGKPVETQKFDDGFESTVYRVNDTFVIFETSPDEKELVYAIQISGDANPAFCGLAGVNLGDPEEKILKTFGKPDDIRDAVDEITNKTIPDTIYLSYDESANFSFETVKGKVSSIKLSAKKNPVAGAEPPVDRFISLCGAKDYYGIIETLAPDFYISKEKEYHQIKGSALDMLMKDPLYKSVFFDKNTGIAAVTKKDRIGGSLRLFSDSKYKTGQVIQIKKGKNKFEIVFVQGFEGWIVWEINFLE